MRKRLFVTDFDGTLLKDDKTISDKDIKTLETLRLKKIYTIIATGRSVYSFEKALNDIGMAGHHNLLPVDYVLFSTGAGIKIFPGGRVICKKELSARDIKKIIHYFDLRKFDYMVHKSIPGTRYFKYKTHGNDNPDFYSRLALYREFSSPLVSGECGYERATEVLAILPGKGDMDFIQTLKKDLSDYSVVQATSPIDHQSVWIEVFHKEVSKAKTISWLARELNVRWQDVVSVGNDYNDQDLLAWSGKGFVVENAPDYLKKIFKTVSSNNRCGMSQAAKASGWMG